MLLSSSNARQESSSQGSTITTTSYVAIRATAYNTREIMQDQTAAKLICIQLKYIKISTYLGEPAQWSPLCSSFCTKRNTCQLIIPISDSDCLYCAWQNSWQQVLPTYPKIRQNKCNSVVFRSLVASKPPRRSSNCSGITAIFWMVSLLLNFCFACLVYFVTSYRSKVEIQK
jgi:hypothetical protein